MKSLQQYPPDPTPTTHVNSPFIQGVCMKELETVRQNVAGRTGFQCMKTYTTRHYQLKNCVLHFDDEADWLQLAFVNDN